MTLRLLEIEPFARVASSIRIDGLFLPLRGGAVVDIGCAPSAEDEARLRPTLFGTQSCFTPGIPQLWAGDEDRVRALVSTTLPPHSPIGAFDFLAVLINSAQYGGAGSSGPITLKPRIAWATTDDIRSPDVLLHELGHAFGLQDEYAFPNTSEYTPPPKPWRNISVHPEPGSTPWESLVDQDRDRLTYAPGQPWTGNRQDVGTFQGAGYDSERRYRPSHDCRMRDPSKDFCRVCSAVILTALDPLANSQVGHED